MPHPPVMTPSGQVAVLVLLVASVLALAALAGPVLLAAAVGAAGVVLAWGWAGLLGLPTPRGTATVLVLGVAAVMSSVGLRIEPPWLTWVPAALSASMIAAFVHQLLRRDGRPRLVESVSSVVLGLGLLSCGALLVPLVHRGPGPWLVVAVAAAAAASAGTDTAGRWDAARPWLTPAALLAGGAAALVVSIPGGLPWPTALLLGVATGAVSHAVRMVLSVLPTMAHSRPRLVAAVASVLAPGAVAFVVAGAPLTGAVTG